MYKAIVNNVQSVGELEVQTHTQLLSPERNNKITIFWTAFHQKVAHRDTVYSSNICVTFKFIIIGTYLVLKKSKYGNDDIYYI